MALHQVEAEVSDGEESDGLPLNAIGHRPGAGITGKRRDFRAVRPLDPIIGTTAGEFAVDLHFDHRQVTPAGEQGALRVYIVDRDPDIAGRKLAADAPHIRVIVDQIGTANCNQKAILVDSIREIFNHPIDELHVLQRQQRQTYGNSNLTMDGGKMHEISGSPRNHKMRQAVKVGSSAMK